MSTKPTTYWIPSFFRELSVMFLALMLAALPFAAAEAQTAPNPGTPVWSMLADGNGGTADRAA